MKVTRQLYVNPLLSFIRGMRRSYAGKWLIYGIVIGTIAGLGACAFFYGLELVKLWTYDIFTGFHAPKPQGEVLFKAVETTNFRPLLFFFLPMIGGLLSGLLVYTFAPEAEGHGTDAVLHAFHNARGEIRARVPFVKSLATIITLASGGSAGREGPIAQIGAGFGSWFGKKLKLDARQRRIMLLAGMAGGLGAIFRAPLGGALTSIEVLYKEDFEAEALIPCVLSSITAYAIFSSLFGYQRIFVIPEFYFRNPLELLWYAILGLVCVPVGYFYVKFFYGLRDRFFKPMSLPRHLKPMVGGFFVGCIGLISPMVYGDGWGQIQLALLGKLTVGAMLLAAFLKILATSFTISSGGSGGVFGPTLFIGGMLGGFIGYLGNFLFPDVITQPGAFVLVGMASFFAGVANAPIGALLMTCEMTGGYGLLVPLMLVSVIALVFTRSWSIYEKQVDNRFSSPAHIGDLTVDILKEMKVEDIFTRQETIITVPPQMKLHEFQRIVFNTTNNYYPVIDDDHILRGIISLKDTRTALFDDDLEPWLVVLDLASPPVTVYLYENLHTALLKFLDSDMGQIPVLEDERKNTILGFLSHEDVIAAYHREIIRRQKISSIDQDAAISTSPSHVTMFTMNRSDMSLSSESIDLPDDTSIQEVVIPDEYAGKSLRDLDLRARFGINVIEIKRKSGLTKTVTILPNPGEILMKKDHLVIIGPKRLIEQFIKEVILG